MNIKKLFLCLFLAFLFSGCNKETIQTVEVTRLVQQTVEVTRIVPQTIIAPNTTPRPDLPTTDAGIVIVRYYTLLDLGMYDQAYQLLSPVNSSLPGLEEYLQSSKQAFKTFEIISLQPYIEWAKKYGHYPTADTETRKNYYVEIIAEGEGGMSGSVKNGVVQGIFLKLVLENGVWKITSFATMPIS